MWNNFYYNTGTGTGREDVTINVHAPLYPVAYIGESEKGIYYEPQNPISVRYVPLVVQKVDYIDKAKIKLTYNKQEKIKIRLICS